MITLFHPTSVATLHRICTYLILRSDIVFPPLFKQFPYQDSMWGWTHGLDLGGARLLGRKLCNYRCTFTETQNHKSLVWLRQVFVSKRHLAL
jgi:hypothetical protein